MTTNTPRGGNSSPPPPLSTGVAPAVRPGDRSPAGLALALARFTEATGVAEGQVLRGEYRSGTSAYDADLWLHITDAQLAVAAAGAFRLEDHPIERDGTTHHNFGGEWNGYAVGITYLGALPAAAPPTGERATP